MNAPELRHKQFWPSTNLAWYIMGIGFGLVVLCFALTAVVISGMTAVRLAKHSGVPSISWSLVALTAPLPGIYGILIFFKVRKRVSGSHGRERLESVVRNGLILLFFCYLLLDVLLIRLSPPVPI
jgi:hypothetical protein